VLGLLTHPESFIGRHVDESSTGQCTQPLLDVSLLALGPLGHCFRSSRLLFTAHLSQGIEQTQFLPQSDHWSDERPEVNTLRTLLQFGHFGRSGMDVE
ncbi:hypothetical protein PENTCL1PPCAC_16343, partial [Pristionchus entomophagus]